MSIRWLSPVLVVSVLLIICHPVGAATFTVTNANPSGAGSLEQAVLDANADVNAPHTIQFNIAGAGVHTIPWSGFISNLFRTMTIDGSTQPGYAGTPLIRLSGSNEGFIIRADNVTIKALSFDVGNAAVQNAGSVTGTKVVGCFFNTDDAGTSIPVGQQSGVAGVDFSFSGSAVEIGGPNPGDGNRFGKVNNGVKVNGSVTGVLIDGNFFGVGATTDGSTNISVFTTTPGAVEIGTRSGNTIANRPGGVLLASGTGTTIVNNSFYGNVNGIVFAAPPVNNGQAPPTIDAAKSSSGSTAIDYTYDNLAAGDYLFQFFSNPVNENQGRTFVGEETRNIAALGSASYSVSFPTTVTVGHYLTATATRVSTGDTSPFATDAVVDAASTFDFASATYSVNEGGLVTITINRSQDLGTESIDYATTGGTATSGVDYTPVSGTITFLNGLTSQTFNVQTLANAAVTTDVTVGLVLSNPSAGGTAGSPSTLTIVNTDVVSDTDGDGVSDVIEDAGPNGGDGNGDSTPDSQQGSVASVPAANGNGYLTVISNCPLDSVAAVAKSSLPTTSTSFPYDLVEFRALCASANMTVLYHAGSSWAGGEAYWKYGPTTPGTPASAAWYELPGVTFDTTTVATATVARATFTLNDGQLGDDTGVDGVIVDQGGPGVPPLPVPAASEWALILLGVILAGVAMFRLR